MGIFGFLNKDKIENENKSKPFHQNVTPSDRRDWFSRTRPWHKVSPQIIDALISKFGEDPMFEVFVITSMEHGLVADYEELGRKEIVDIPEAICPHIAGVIYSKGSLFGEKFNHLFHNGGSQKKISALYSNAMNCLDSSIALSEYLIPAYVNLAVLRATLGKNDNALKYINIGLQKIEELDGISGVMIKSNIDSIANAPQNFEDARQTLLSMQEDLS